MNIYFTYYFVSKEKVLIMKFSKKISVRSRSKSKELTLRLLPRLMSSSPMSCELVSATLQFSRIHNHYSLQNTFYKNRDYSSSAGQLAFIKYFCMSGNSRHPIRHS